MNLFALLHIIFKAHLRSSGSDQDGFSDQNQTVALSCTDADSASDSDTAVIAAVREGHEDKARTDRHVIRPRGEPKADMFRFHKAHAMRVVWSETQLLRAHDHLAIRL